MTVVNRSEPPTAGVLGRRLALVGLGLLLWAAWSALLRLFVYAETAWDSTTAAVQHPIAGVLNFLALVLWLASWAAVARQATTAAFVCTAPYRHVRNPMAWAALLQGLGLAWCYAAPLTAVATMLLVPTADVLLRRWREGVLERRFGHLFVLYRRRVRTWRPRWSGYDPAHEEREPPLAAERTTPPGRAVVLYDGHCKFCTAGSERLLRLARPGAVERVDFQQPGALDRFPGVSHDACMVQMYLIEPDGRVFGGFEAAVRAVTTRPLLGWPARLYYLPGVRLLCDLFYRLLAAYRYRLLGKAVAAGECDGGSCALHFKPASGGRKPPECARLEASPRGTDVPRSP
jgi:predicted DCC family thiol-disulfide oxidoreductase YuxK/protein-S-isoprenylcysteine O-methyltransferase Ste14